MRRKINEDPELTQMSKFPEKFIEQLSNYN